MGCGLGEAMYRIATGIEARPDLTDVTFDAVPENETPFDLTLRWLKDQIPADAVGEAEGICGDLIL